MQRGEKHVLSHAAIYLIARGLPGVVAFCAIPLFTRLLDPASYGRYALVIATVSMLNALLFQWLRLSMTRYLPAYAGDEARLKDTLVGLAAGIAGVLGVLAAGAMAIVPAVRAHASLIALGWVLLAVQVLFELCCEYSRASLNPWQFMTLQLGRAFASVGIGAGLIWLGLGWWGPLLGLSLGMTLGVVFAYRRDWRSTRLSVDRDVLAKLARYGLPLSLTVALAVVISTSDRFLIAAMMGEDAAGLYAVAYDFTSQTLTLLMIAINLAMFPLAVRALEARGRDAAREQMRHNASLLVAVGFPCVAGLAVVTPGIVACLFGASFRAAAVGIIPLVAIGAFLEGLKAYHFDAAFQFAHQTIHQVWIVLVVAAVNVALNLVAIPRWGIEGSAVVSSLAYVLSIALTAAVGRRHFALPFPLAASAKVVLASAVMAAALWPTRSYVGPVTLAGQVIGGAALYGVILIVTNFLGLRDSIRDHVVARATRRAALNRPSRTLDPAAQLAETN